MKAALLLLLLYSIAVGACAPHTSNSKQHARKQASATENRSTNTLGGK